MVFLSNQQHYYLRYYYISITRYFMNTPLDVLFLTDYSTYVIVMDFEESSISCNIMY